MSYCRPKAEELYLLHPLLLILTYNPPRGFTDSFLRLMLSLCIICMFNCLRCILALIQMFSEPVYDDYYNHIAGPTGPPGITGPPGMLDPNAPEPPGPPRSRRRNYSHRVRLNGLSCYRSELFDVHS